MAVSTLHPEPAVFCLFLSPPHCARPARAPAFNPPPSAAQGHATRPKPLPRAGHGPAISRRHVQRTLTREAPRFPGPGQQGLTFLFLDICTAMLSPRAAVKKGSGSLAEVSIKGAEQRRRTARRLRLLVFMGNVVFRQALRKRGE